MIKAIETEYKGYRFRSRLEARWAVFFDALGLRWEYEKEGFEFDDGTRYLPDFWMLDLGCWIEIKPEIAFGSWPDDGFRELCLLEEQSKNRAVMLCGSPGRVYELYEKENTYQGFVPGDSNYVWCECPYCGSIGIQFDGRSARNNHTDDCPNRHTPNNDKTYSYDTQKLRDAYDAARSARFEHGENGRRA